MKSESWSLQNDKNQFGKVVATALHGKPLNLTLRGREVVVVAVAEYFVRLEKSKASTSQRFVNICLGCQSTMLSFELRKLTPDQNAVTWFSSTPEKSLYICEV